MSRHKYIFDGFFTRHADMSPVIVFALAYDKVSQPFCNRSCIAAYGYNNTTSSVPRLLSPGSPLTVLGAVSFAIVYPFYLIRIIRWVPHVIYKLSVVIPSFAYSYAPTAIVLIYRACRDITSISHSLPYSVGSSIRFTMLVKRFTTKIFPVTTTTFRSAVEYIISAKRSCFPTITGTKHFLFWKKFNSSQTIIFFINFNHICNYSTTNGREYNA